MVTPNDYEKYFLMLADVKWGKSLIKSNGNIVPKAGCFGRMLSCLCSGGYNVSRAQRIVLDKVNAYMSEAKALGTVIEQERLDVVMPAITKLNELVEYIVTKNPRSKLLPIQRSYDIIFKCSPKAVEPAKVATPPIKRIASASPVTQALIKEHGG